MIGNKIRVLIVEDSLLMRRVIEDIIKSDPALEVVAAADEGNLAFERISQFKPDVVTLDINLPGMSGLDVLSRIIDMKCSRVIMLSAYSRKGASATIRALELGAVDFIAKPSGEISLDLAKFKEEIISKIKLAAEIKLDNLPYYGTAVAQDLKVKPAINKVVVIGASTGGPKAVIEVMQGIIYGLPAVYLIVQHMPLEFTANFAERISWKSGITTKEAEDGDGLSANKAFVAPGGSQMVLQNCEGQIKIALNQESTGGYIKPSIDVTMASAAEFFGKDVIGVILTGMGKDGLEGARKIKEKGGTVIIQDENTSVVWGMPKVIHKEGLADQVLPLSEIAHAIAEKI